VSVTCCRTGLVVASAVFNAARYWIYRPSGLVIAPPAAEAQADQVPSLGFVVFPVRVSIASDVPVGWLLSVIILSQSTPTPASSRRETKTLVVA
jgi:hypothetical protein